jgi:hypothetical protein
MKARTFRAKTDDRHRVVIPHANIRRLGKKFGVFDWEGVIIEFEIKSIRFNDGKQVTF